MARVPFTTAVGCKCAVSGRSNFRGLRRSAPLSAHSMHGRIQGRWFGSVLYVVAWDATHVLPSLRTVHTCAADRPSSSNGFPREVGAEPFTIL